MGSNATDQEVLGLLTEGVALCREAGRGDLGHVLEIAAARLRRPSTVVCVVGEYKQGKSHVVNALAGYDVCAVDDDLATTAITVIGHGDPPAAFVHRSEDGTRIVDEIGLDDVARFTSETEGAEPDVAIDMVEVTVPSPVLEGGLALVDTPGVNALRPGSDRAILDFLRYADGLILVTDASAELSPPELRFLAAARDVCPSVLVVLSKIDLYPEWRRIADLDADHLSAVGLEGSLLPVSSTLRALGLAEGDARLAEESGYRRLTARVEERILGAARRTGRWRALGDLQRVIGTLGSAEAKRLAALQDPTAAEVRLRDLEAAQQGVAAMREASSKWLVALNDGMADIRGEVEYRLRSAMRGLLQESDRRLSDAKPGPVWDELCADLRVSLADEADRIFSTIRQGATQVAARLAALIAEDVSVAVPEGVGFDPDELWSSDERELTIKGSNVLSSGLSVLRGGYSGMLMLGMLGQLAGIAALGTATLGAGALFGAKQFRDERKRQLERQRQEARGVLRHYLEQVQLELGTRIQRAVQETHRALRDHFGDRIQELSASYAASVRQLQEALQADAARRSELAAESKRRTDELERLKGRLPPRSEPGS